MYGYVMEGGRASLTMRQIGGVWFAVAVLPRSGFLAAYRRGRLLRRLRRQGIVRCVLPSSLTAEAERYGLHGVAVEGLRLALLSDYYSRPDTAPQHILVVNYAGIDMERLPEGLRRLAQIWEEPSCMTN